MKLYCAISCCAYDHTGEEVVRIAYSENPEGSTTYRTILAVRAFRKSLAYYCHITDFLSIVTSLANAFFCFLRLYFLNEKVIPTYLFLIGTFFTFPGLRLEVNHLIIYCAMMVEMIYYVVIDWRFFKQSSFCRLLMTGSV